MLVFLIERGLIEFFRKFFSRNFLGNDTNLKKQFLGNLILIFEFYLKQNKHLHYWSTKGLINKKIETTTWLEGVRIFNLLLSIKKIVLDHQYNKEVCHKLCSGIQKDQLS